MFIEYIGAIVFIRLLFAIENRQNIKSFKIIFKLLILKQLSNNKYYVHNRVILTIFCNSGLNYTFKLTKQNLNFFKSYLPKTLMNFYCTMLLYYIE